MLNLSAIEGTCEISIIPLTFYPHDLLFIFELIKSLKASHFTGMIERLLEEHAARWALDHVCYCYVQ